MSAPRLDHGVLNIPGRTSGINAELDRHNAAARAEAHAQAKAAAAVKRERQAEAKGIVAAWTDEQCVVRASAFTGRRKLTAKQARARLNSAAHWTPGNVIAFAKELAS